MCPSSSCGVRFDLRNDTGTLVSLVQLKKHPVPGADSRKLVHSLLTPWPNRELVADAEEPERRFRKSGSRRPLHEGAEAGRLAEKGRAEAAELLGVHKDLHHPMKVAWHCGGILLDFQFVAGRRATKIFQRRIPRAFFCTFIYLKKYFHTNFFYIFHVNTSIFHPPRFKSSSVIKTATHCVVFFFL